MKPVVAFIRSKGILIIIYLDDILLAAQTYHERLCQTNFAIDLLESLGFRINREKSQLIPSQHIPFLGFVVHSATMTTGLPLEKIASIQSLAVTLKESSQPVTLRSLSRFIGMCTTTRLEVFQAPAHYHHLQFLKNSVLQNSSELNWVYNRKVSLNQAAKEDLVWWINHLSQNSTQPIILPSPNKIITTDSSDFGWGIWSGGDHSQGPWSGGETRWHINLKELMAGFIGLKLYVKGQSYLTHISLQMDNMTACHYINHLGGTGSVNLCLLALKMWKWCRQRNIHISAFYIPGQLNFIADILSRLINLNSEWKLNPAIFRQICVIYTTPDLDLLQQEQTIKFRNSFHGSQIQMLWQPMLSNSLVKPAMLCISPLQSNYEMPKKIQSDKGKVLLIALVWRSRPWFPILLSMLYDRLLLLPSTSDVLILPSHPGRMPQKQVTLAVWPLSGDALVSSNFLRGCPTSSCPHGGQELKHSIKVLGQSGVAGVLKNKKILFLVI